MHKSPFPKIIAIVGPTATGKSDFGVLLAKKFNGEIISADSRQVYEGMDIGTGKITKKEMLGIPHHLLGIVSPKGPNFNVNKFKKLADKTIKDILKRGKTPILVGGTGFWIDAVVYNQTFPEVKPNNELRAKLNKYSEEKLKATLTKLDPQRALNIDWKNKRRVIRAIEVAKTLKTSSVGAHTSSPIYQTLFIGLDLPDETLLKKISTRLEKRLKQGMIAEVKKLRNSGVSWKKLDSFGLEYRFVSQYLLGKLSKTETQQQLLLAIKNYAKRQRTWFKRNKDISWFNPTKKQSLSQGNALVKSFLKN